VIFRHALRNSILPIITLLGLQIPYLISGSVIVEKVFGIQGMGYMTFEAILHRDYPTLMGVATLTALLTMVGILVSDLLYAVVDPRISYS
jgi:peptide/nickel transport system permease protein